MISWCQDVLGQKRLWGFWKQLLLPSSDKRHMSLSVGPLKTFLLFKSAGEISSWLGQVPKPAAVEADVYFGAQSFQIARKTGILNPMPRGPICIVPDAGTFLESIQARSGVPFARRLFGMGPEMPNQEVARWGAESLIVGGTFHWATKHTIQGPRDIFGNPDLHFLELMEAHPMSDQWDLVTAVKRDAPPRTHFLHQVMEQTRWEGHGLFGATKVFPRFFRTLSPRPMDPMPQGRPRALYTGSYAGSYDFPYPLTTNYFPFGNFALHLSPGFNVSETGIDLHLVQPEDRRDLYWAAAVNHSESGSLVITEMKPEGGTLTDFICFERDHSFHPANLVLAVLIETARRRRFKTVAATRFIDRLGMSIVGEYERRFRQAGLRYVGGKVYEREITPDWDPLKGMSHRRELPETQALIASLADQLAACFEELGW